MLDGLQPQLRRVPLVVTARPTVATIDPALIHLQNPQITPVSLPGRPRGSFASPTLIAPASPPADTMLSEAPENPAKRYFLPQYTIASAPGGGPRAQWVSLAGTGTGCTLTVHLAETTQAAMSGGNTRLSPPTRYLVTASLHGRVVSWDLAAAPAVQGASLTLTVAMTDPSAQARLILRRSLDLALPAFRQPAAYMPGHQAIDTAIPFTFS